MTGAALALHLRKAIPPAGVEPVQSLSAVKRCLLALTRDSATLSIKVLPARLSGDAFRGTVAQTDPTRCYLA
jgi:hypothetical protein